jgi:hypothetical protein
MQFREELIGETMAIFTKKKLLLILFFLFLFIFVLLVKYIFFTDRLDYQEITRVYNEDHDRVLVGYIGNCGALCTWTVKVDLEDLDGKVLRSRVFYSTRCGELAIKWIDSEKAKINSVLIYVYKDHFDTRSDIGSACPE